MSLERPPPDVATSRRGLLDVPARVRTVIVVLGLAGVVMIGIASLESAGGHRIQTDKLLHFGGYFTLAVLFVVGLPPKLFAVALLGLAVLGAGIELLQPLQGRTRDAGDLLANALGIAVGALAGLTVRMLLAWIRTDLAEREAVERTETFADGAVVFAQGQRSDGIYVVRRGGVRILRDANGRREQLERVGPGGVVGELGVIQDEPRYATAVADGATTLYRVDVEELGDAVRGETAALPIVRALARRLRAANARADARREGAPPDGA